uniref:Glycosyl transferase 64 domain-containing protein n=1 Tax=Rhizochromulina marina TaxID=1034831 RepID=A0A7S2W219_9STRA
MASKYTVRINTFRRNDLLKKVVEQYATCPKIHSIQVIWSDLAAAPPPMSFFDLPNSYDQPSSYKSASASTPMIEFEIHTVDSLNNRFRPILDIATKAVFSVDDDLHIPCGLLDFTHQVWRAAPHTMVGFMPRMHGYDTLSRRFTYHDWWYVWRHGLYSMVLTKACFLHRDFLYAYAAVTKRPGLTTDMFVREPRITGRRLAPSSHGHRPRRRPRPAPSGTTPLAPENHTMRAVHDYVDAHMNCEDIAMSFLVANMSHEPAVWVRGTGVREIGSTGLSSDQQRHYRERGMCIHEFVSLFGNLPLVPATHKVDRASNFWFWR